MTTQVNERIDRLSERVNQLEGKVVEIDSTISAMNTKPACRKVDVKLPEPISVDKPDVKGIKETSDRHLDTKFGDLLFDIFW